MMSFSYFYSRETNIPYYSMTVGHKNIKVDYKVMEFIKSNLFVNIDQLLKWNMFLL